MCYIAFGEKIKFKDEVEETKGHKALTMMNQAYCYLGNDLYRISKVQRDLLRTLNIKFNVKPK